MCGPGVERAEEQPDKAEEVFVAVLLCVVATGHVDVFSF